MTDLEETRIASREVHRGGYLTVRVDRFRGADGRQHDRDVVEHPGAVAILAIDGDDILLVRQFRAPVQRVLLEIPAGTLDRADDGSTEAPEVAAPRELAEETGMRAREWRKLGRFFTAPGFTNEDMHLYLACDLEAIPDYAGAQEDEALHLVRMPWREAVSLAEEGAIEDAKSLVGLFWLERLALRGEL